MLIQFYKFIEHIKSSPARKNKLIVIPLAIGLVLNFAIWALIYFKLRPYVNNLPEDQAFIPLHYNIFLGIDAFGRWQKIFILPGLGLFIFILNFILTFLIYNKKELLSYFINLATVLVQIFLLISTLFIILINL